MKIINIILFCFLFYFPMSYADYAGGNIITFYHGIGGLRTNQKVVALTFDDGPHPVYTRQILKILRDNDVNATFFVVGKNVEKYPGVIKEAYLDGNVIANHTYSHFSLLQLSDAQIREELLKSEKAIYKVIHECPVLFRPPYGACSSRLVGLLRNFGFTTITWNDMTNDYMANEVTSSKIARDIIGLARPGSIIGLHDGGGDRQKGVRALAIIIRVLKERGYEFVTVPELLNIEGYATTV
jgi:peptidoglycan/xylan/chitin deacetylase (PgdA/CDA1 family)